MSTYSPFYWGSNLVSADPHMVSGAEVVRKNGLVFLQGLYTTCEFLTGSPVMPVRTGEWFDQRFLLKHLPVLVGRVHIESQKE